MTPWRAAISIYDALLEVSSMQIATPVLIQPKSDPIYPHPIRTVKFLLFKKPQPKNLENSLQAWHPSPHLHALIGQLLHVYYSLIPTTTKSLSQVGDNRTLQAGEFWRDFLFLI